MQPRPNSLQLSLINAKHTGMNALMNRLSKVGCWKLSFFRISAYFVVLFSDYLTHCMETVLYFTIPEEDFACIPLRMFLSTLLANVVCKPIIDMLSEPDFINLQVAKSVWERKKQRILGIIIFLFRILIVTVNKRTTEQWNFSTIIASVWWRWRIESRSPVDNKGNGCG